MSEQDTPRTENIIIDTATLDPTRQGAFNYALRTRQHLDIAHKTIMDALDAGIVNPTGAQLMTELVNSIDRRVLKDLASIGGIELPEGHALLEAFEVTNDPRRNQ